MSRAEVVELIRRGERFLLSGHRGPDADALGSALGLAAILRSLGKRADVYCPDRVPYSLEFLVGVPSLLSTVPDDARYDATFVTDAAAEQLLPVPFPSREVSGTLVVLDHHAAHGDFGDVVVREVDACATAEVVVRIMRDLGIARVPEEAATPLYAAIVADTGGFRYSSTRAATLRLGAELVEAGADPWQVAYNLFEGWPRERMDLLREVLRTLRIRARRRARRHRGAPRDARGRRCHRGHGRGVGELRPATARRRSGSASLGASPPSAGDARVRVSLRARGDVDVAAIASTLGGGGHRAAAGATVAGLSTRSPPESSARHAMRSLGADVSVARPNDVHGVLVVDKPAGPTSHDVVQRVRRALDTRRVGHAGTLDPAATGVLVLAIGEGTKLVPWLVAADKSYDAEIVLGAETDTLDADGRVVARAPVPALDRDDVVRALGAFLGARLQRAPRVSAIKVLGKPLHARARRGEDVLPPVREVVLHRADAELVAEDRITLSLDCGKGFYVRSLAHDLGIALGTLAHLSSLRRTRSGAFTLDMAVPFAFVDRAAAGDPEARAELLGRALSVADAWPGPRAELTGEGCLAAGHGARDPGDRRPGGMAGRGRRRGARARAGRRRGRDCRTERRCPLRRSGSPTATVDRVGGRRRIWRATWIDATFRAWPARAGASRSWQRSSLSRRAATTRRRPTVARLTPGGTEAQSMPRATEVPCASPLAGRRRSVVAPRPSPRAPTRSPTSRTAVSAATTARPVAGSRARELGVCAGG